MVKDILQEIVEHKREELELWKTPKPSLRKALLQSEIPMSTISVGTTILSDMPVSRE